MCGLNLPKMTEFLTMASGLSTEGRNEDSVLTGDAGLEDPSTGTRL